MLGQLRNMLKMHSNVARLQWHWSLLNTLSGEGWHRDESVIVPVLEALPGAESLHCPQLVQAAQFCLFKSACTGASENLLSFVETVTHGTVHSNPCRCSREAEKSPCPPSHLLPFSPSKKVLWQLVFLCRNVQFQEVRIFLQKTLQMENFQI